MLDTHSDTQLLSTSPIQERRPVMTEEEKLAEFEARIARGEKIEPGDWMPDEYRRQLIRMISQHAHSEVVGML
ncbi:MAG: phenylacetate-CoA oxygenase subunit PaaI, partial [Anaerolineales bacterium]|nr:phenylacetate-CoA oxygenase subunit PaaI [Anaerolineales bacterium]